MKRSVILSVLVLAGSAGLLMGKAAPKTDVVEAQQFLLRDDQGRLRASLKVDDRGPQLTFYDAEVPVRTGGMGDTKGVPRDKLVVPRMIVGLYGNMPSVRMDGVDLSMTETGPHLILYDSKNQGGIEVLVRDGIGPTMTFMAADNAIRGRVEIRTEEPYIKVIGFSGKVLYPAP